MFDTLVIHYNYLHTKSAYPPQGPPSKHLSHKDEIIFVLPSLSKKHHWEHSSNYKSYHQSPQHHPTSTPSIQ